MISQYLYAYKKRGSYFLLLHTLLCFCRRCFLHCGDETYTTNLCIKNFVSFIAVSTKTKFWNCVSAYYCLSTVYHPNPDYRYTVAYVLRVLVLVTLCHHNKNSAISREMQNASHLKFLQTKKATISKMFFAYRFCSMKTLLCNKPEPINRWFTSSFFAYFWNAMMIELCFILLYSLHSTGMNFAWRFESSFLSSVCWMFSQNLEPLIFFYCTYVAFTRLKSGV